MIPVLFTFTQKTAQTKARTARDKAPNNATVPRTKGALELFAWFSTERNRHNFIEIFPERIDRMAVSRFDNPTWLNSSV